MRELNQLSADEEEIRNYAIAYFMEKQSSNSNNPLKYCSECGKLSNYLYQCSYGYIFKCKMRLCKECLRVHKNKIYCIKHFLQIKGISHQL